MTSVIDGDTIKVVEDGGTLERTVRLLGIDTPETTKPGAPVECGGPQATGAMLALTFASPVDSNGDTLIDQKGGRGAEVELLTDRTQDLKDRYGRVLAYVRVVAIDPAVPQAPARPAGYDVGLEMIKTGWADVYVFDDEFGRVNRYSDASDTASTVGVGVHGACGGNFHVPAFAARVPAR